jgi:hypothetical protein
MKKLIGMLNKVSVGLNILFCSLMFVIHYTEMKWSKSLSSIITSNIELFSKIDQELIANSKIISGNTNLYAYLKTFLYKK